MPTIDLAGELELLESLVSPFGPVAAVRPSGSPIRALGRVTRVGTLVGSGSPGRSVHGGGPNGTIRAGGCTIDNPSRARLIAIAEGAERYAAGDFLGEHRVLGTASDLTGPVLDPGRFPRCSAREYDNPGCPLRQFDPSAPIRWEQGIDLVTRQVTWLPAVMACYRLRDLLPSERFSYRISTGFAVHSDPVEALVRAICEVIERDVIAVLWLQRLPLPLVAERYVSARVQYLLDWSRNHFIDTYLFDATTDMGVPTAYCLQTAEHDTRARNVVGCASARDMEAAAERALLEALQGRGAFYSDAEIPAELSQFSDVMDGARYMARPQMASAFDFLVDGARQRVAPERQILPTAPAQALAWLIAMLSGMGMQAVAVDRTPRELAAVGLTAVNVVIPDLQPMSLLPFAQFRAHPRLYAAPALMGYPSHAEEELNSWPNPFG